MKAVVGAVGVRRNDGNDDAADVVFVLFLA